MLPIDHSLDLDHRDPELNLHERHGFLSEKPLVAKLSAPQLKAWALECPDGVEGLFVVDPVDHNRTGALWAPNPVCGLVAVDGH